MNFRKTLVQCLLILAGLCAGIAGFTCALAFLASDACLDAGGAVGDSVFACLLRGGEQVPWRALVRPGMVVSALVFAAILMLLVLGVLRCWSPRRRRDENRL